MLRLCLEAARLRRISSQESGVRKKTFLLNNSTAPFQNSQVFLNIRNKMFKDHLFIYPADEAGCSFADSEVTEAAINMKRIEIMFEE